MGVVYTAIKDGISNRGIRNAQLSDYHRRLGRHRGGTLATSVVNGLEQITRLHRIERTAEPVVEDEQTHLDERVELSRVQSMRMGMGKCPGASVDYNHL